MYSTISYQIDVPDELWDAYKRMHDDRDRVNGPIVESMAAEVREHHSGDLDPQVQSQISMVLDDGGEP